MKIAFGTGNRIRKEICTDQDINHNMRELHFIVDAIGRPGLPEAPPKEAGNEPGTGHPDHDTWFPERDDQIDVEPARAYVRFKLNSAFSNSTRPQGGGFIQHSPAATIFDPDGVAYNPAQTYDVYDVLNRYPSAVGSEYGYGLMYDDGSGNQYLELVHLGGWSAASGSDNFKVRLSDQGGGADTDEFLEAKFDASTAFSGATHQLVYGDADPAVTTPPYQMRLYTAKSASNTDEKVKVDSANTAGYLLDQFENAGATPYNVSNHTIAYVDEIGTTPNKEVRVYYDTPALTNNNQVKVTTNDLTEEFLHGSINNQSTYVAATHNLVYAEVVGASGTNQKLRLFTDKPSVTVEDGIVEIFRLPSGQTIPAASGGTPGKLTTTALKQTFNGTVFADGAATTIYNPTSVPVAAVGANRYISAVKVNGFYLVVHDEPRMRFGVNESGAVSAATGTRSGTVNFSSVSLREYTSAGARLGTTFTVKSGIFSSIPQWTFMGAIPHGADWFIVMAGCDVIPSS